MSKNHDNLKAIEPERWRQFFQRPRPSIENEFSPYFYRYFSRLFGNPRRIEGYLELCGYLFTVAQAKNASVLDLGCGFGLMATLFGLFGAKEVVGYDQNIEKIELFRKLLLRLAPEVNNVKPVLGDSARINFPSDFFDVVIVNETISHVKDLLGSLDEAKRILKSGGRLLVRDGNNGLFFPERISRRRFWRRIERGPVDPSVFRSTDIPLPFREVRRKMVSERFPELERGRIELLSIRTAGMYGEEIFEAVEEFEKTGKISMRPQSRYRNPMTGEFPERELNPITLRRILMRKGFEASFVPYFHSKSINDIESFIKKLLSLAAIHFRFLHLFFVPGFAILGMKKESPI